MDATGPPAEDPAPRGGAVGPATRAMTGPHPAVAVARGAVRVALADLSPDALLLVACSGGPDSVALAAATAFVAPRLGLRAGAVSIDHRLQPGSGVVAAGAISTCRRLGLNPAWVEDVDVEGPGGPEGAARVARHAAFDRAAAQTGAVAVMLGHTLDDQAETVLLALARGSGARSLAGMAATRGILRRPFLGLRRAQTEAVCAALELPVWLDPTNALPGANRRAALRRHVVPALERALGPGVVPALARSAALLRDDADLLDALGRDLLEASRISSAPGELTLDVERLAQAPAALRGRALREAAIAVGAPPGGLGSAHVRALTALVVTWHGQGPAHLPGGVTAGRACGRLTLRSPSTPE